MMLIIMLFFSIQVLVSKSLLYPIKNKLFFVFFVHVLLSSQSQLLQYISKPGDIAPDAPTTTRITITSFIPLIPAIPSLSAFYLSMFPTLLSFTHSSLGMVISMIITSILVLSITTISGRRASFLVLQ